MRRKGCLVGSDQVARVMKNPRDCGRATGKTSCHDPVKNQRHLPNREGEQEVCCKASDPTLVRRHYVRGDMVRVYVCGVCHRHFLPQTRRLACVINTKNRHVAPAGVEHGGMGGVR